MEGQWYQRSKEAADEADEAGLELAQTAKHYQKENDNGVKNDKNNCLFFVFVGHVSTITQLYCTANFS